MCRFEARHQNVQNKRPSTIALGRNGSKERRVGIVVYVTLKRFTILQADAGGCCFIFRYGCRFARVVTDTLPIIQNTLNPKD
jgi:hypothetical protein